MKFDQMTKQQQFDTLRHMREDGGHFVNALSTAWMRADEHNSARLAAAFPDIVARYAPEQPALPWADLPNAEPINRVLAHFKAHPERWTTTKDETWEKAVSAAWYAAYVRSRVGARDAVLAAAVATTPHKSGWPHDAAWYAVSGALVALVAYDGCAYHMTRPNLTKVDAEAGVTEAVLLLPAALAMEAA